MFCSIPFAFHFTIFWELAKLGPAPVLGYKHRGEDVSASEQREGQSCPVFSGRPRVTGQSPQAERSFARAAGEPLICRAAAGKCRVRTPHAWKHRPGKLGGLGPFAPCSCSAAGNPTQAQGWCWCSGCLRRAPRWQCLHVPNSPFPG